MTLPDKKKQELTKKQNAFLDALFENGGNINEAMLSSDYQQGSKGWLVKSLRGEIIERAKYELAGSAVKSVKRISETLDADGTIPNSQMELRMKAATDILDRVGISKRQEIDIKAELIHGVVLLPAKTSEKSITING
tara:strand:+ start:174 stop:584 length:411 start_codon:yes stop_codon:yes gene_type:complete